MNDHPLVQALREAFAQNHHPDIAEQQAAYMKYRFPFFGIQSPLRRSLQQEIFASHPLLSADELMDCLEQLWDQKEREFQHAALDLAEKYKKLWAENIEDIFGTFAIMVLSKSWWDTVDVLATKLIGMLVYRHPSLLEHLDQWHESRNMWQRRTAILYQLKYKQKTDTNRLSRAIRATIHEKEFFIRKAIGWALREYSRTNPDFVVTFTDRHKATLSTLSFREARRLLAPTHETGSPIKPGTT